MLSSTIYTKGIYGHRAVIERLERLIDEDRLPHALLFSGPDGVGKSLVAKRLCAAFLCREGNHRDGDHGDGDRSRKTGSGDGPVCSRVLKGLHPDMHWVEAAEGRRDIVIDQVRALTAAIGARPFEAEGRAAVLNDGDRMNEESQNAFLKTLEEPPPGTLIIVVSSSPDRLLSTIRSRCQRFVFRRLASEEMERFLAEREDLARILPERLAEGRPGRLVRYVEEGVDRVRTVFMEFLSHPRKSSPVRYAGELMSWASGEGETKQRQRERLRMALDIGATLIRDISVIESGAAFEVETEDESEAGDASGSGARFLLNPDLSIKLEGCLGLYTPRGLDHGMGAFVEGAEDLARYVDPGLAVENLLRTLRDMRK